jgi:integrase
MSVNTLESSNATQSKGPDFRRVGENLYRLNTSGGYYALLKRGGKQFRRSLKTTDKELAKRRLGELREKVGRLSTDKGVRNISFAELAARWLDIQKAKLKESSATRNEGCVKALAPFFKGVAFKNITRMQCENWVTKRGQKISASSYKQERRILIAIFKYAISLGIVLDNVAEDALPTRTISSKQVIIPTQEQFDLLAKTMRQADVRGVHGANLVELLAYSGMRLREATNLLWKDVDFDRGCFTVTGGETGTKNHEIRNVPLFPAMKELLERIKGDSTPVPESRIIPINDAKTLMRNSSSKANLPIFTHHDMRHYFCSNAIEAGIDFKVIAGWLGHKDGGILVAKTYGHLRDAHSFEMAKRMVFSAASSEKPKNVITAEEVRTS